MIPQWKKNFDKNEIIKRFKYALKNKNLSEGPIVKTFEKDFKVSWSKICCISSKWNNWTVNSFFSIRFET